MSKRAISVTLETDNLNWLKGRASATGVHSVSELLDQLVRGARASGRVGPSRSVVGTIDVADDDPSLERADQAVRGIVDASLRRPLAAKAGPAGSGGRKRSRRG